MKPKVVIVIGVVLLGFGIAVSAMVNLELAGINERIFHIENSYPFPPQEQEQEYNSLLEERNLYQNVIVPLFGMVIIIGLALIVVGAIISLRARDKPRP